MSRRGGIARIENGPPPRELIEAMGFASGLLGQHFSGGNTPPTFLPPGRYRYQTIEIHNGRHYSMTTTLNIRSPSANSEPRDRVDDDPMSAPGGTDRRPDPSGRNRWSPHGQARGGLKSFSSLQTAAEVRIPIWMERQEAEQVLANAFERSHIPQDGEIEIVCPNPNSDDFVVRSRGARRTGGAGGSGFAFDDDFPITPPDTAPIPASDAAINSLGTKTITEAENGQTCGICMDDKNLDDVVAELKCGHWFDLECVEIWLEQNGTCPTCRERVESVAEGFVRDLGIDTGRGAQDRSHRSRASNHQVGPSSSGLSSANTMRPPTRHARSSNDHVPSSSTSNITRPPSRNPRRDHSYSPRYFGDHERSRSDRSSRRYYHHGGPRYSTTQRLPRNSSTASPDTLGRHTHR